MAVKLTIDGTEIEVAPGTTILQACEMVGAEIPRFCYHERLSVAGNCRMCLVEVEKAPKPIASCAMAVAPDMVVHTKSETVQAARQGVMEFLLINHPLDCPICDQGGECDLQDQALGFGHDASRFAENKRAVEEKNMGPLIKTVMTRCIHCTRCVRFATEVAGVPELGAIGRGEDMEITTYLEAALQSELSGNVIDLCPVGALTSKPYAFAARAWELDKTETVDVMDAMGARIRVDARGREVMRIMPLNHDAINEEWLSDKSRFVGDGLNTQRLDRPYLRQADGRLAPIDWDAALAEAAAALTDKGAGKASRIGALAGDLACAEGQFALKSLLAELSCPHLDCRQDGSPIGAEARGDYLFNTTIAGIEDADALLIIGANPRLEAPVLNARIRKRWRRGDLPIGLIGRAAELTYDYTHIGEGAADLERFVGGRQAFMRVLKQAARPMLILGAGAVARNDGAAVHGLARQLAENTGMIGKDWNGFNLLQCAAGRVAGLDMGFLPRKGGRDTQAILSAARRGALDTIILLGADEIDMSALENTFTIYIGSHGDRGAHAADLILPAAAYTEKQATYVNLEGRVQMSERAVFPPGEAREDWKIFRALSARLGKTLPFDNLSELRARLYAAVPHFAELDNLTAAPLSKPPKKSMGVRADAFVSGIDNFWQSNAIARASSVLARCAAAQTKAEKND